MLAVAPSPVLGHAQPRIGPPQPLQHGSATFRDFASGIGIDLRPWQEIVARFITATTPDDHWLYPEVAVIVARRNGKTTLLVPLILQRLLVGDKVTHTAQNRDLPREIHRIVAEIIERDYSHLLPSRNGRPIRPRFANGQEEIRVKGGGEYKIVAPSSAGARGLTSDLLIVDELREMEDERFLHAAKPTIATRQWGQVIYLSNAGTDDSLVLNNLRKRAGEDPRLAYLEWSASPEHGTGDVEGWLEANPSIGHDPELLPYLSREHQSASLTGSLAGFETEHLCRWVPTMRPRLVDDLAWKRAHALKVAAVRRPSFGISYDPSGRASVVMAWREDAEHVALRELFDVEVDETGIVELGADALKAARRYGAMNVGYDDATDRDLARQFTAAKGSKLAKAVRPVIGKDFANATEAFVRGIESGTLRWQDGDHITADLTMTSRKDNDEAGTFTAVRSKDDVPITAALAAIRAYWLASASPRPSSLQVR